MNYHFKNDPVPLPGWALVVFFALLAGLLFAMHVQTMAALGDIRGCTTVYAPGRILPGSPMVLQSSCNDNYHPKPTKRPPPEVRHPQST